MFKCLCTIVSVGGLESHQNRLKNASMPFKGSLSTSTPIVQTPVKCSSINNSGELPKALNSSEAIQHVAIMPEISTGPRLVQGHVEIANQNFPSSKEPLSSVALSSSVNHNEFYSLYSSDSGIDAVTLPTSSGAIAAAFTVVQGPSENNSEPFLYNKQSTGATERAFENQQFKTDSAIAVIRGGVKNKNASKFVSDRSAVTLKKKNRSAKNGKQPILHKTTKEQQNARPTSQTERKLIVQDCAVQTDNANNLRNEYQPTNLLIDDYVSRLASKKYVIDNKSSDSCIKCVAERDVVQGFDKINFQSDASVGSDTNKTINSNGTNIFEDNGGNKYSEKQAFQSTKIDVDEFANSLNVELANTNNNRDDLDLPSGRVPIRMDSLTRLIGIHSSQQELQYLLRRLNEVIAKQDWREVISLVRDINEKIQKLFVVSGFLNWQNELQMSLQPVRSENVQLRK